MKNNDEVLDWMNMLAREGFNTDVFAFGFYASMHEDSLEDSEELSKKLQEIMQKYRDKYHKEPPMLLELLPYYKDQGER